MIPTAQTMLGSKKFLATMGGVLVAVGNAKGWLGLPADAVLQVLGMLGSYVVGQGIADIGKTRPTLTATSIGQVQPVAPVKK